MLVLCADWCCYAGYTPCVSKSPWKGIFYKIIIIEKVPYASLCHFEKNSILMQDGSRGAIFVHILDELKIISDSSHI